MEAISNPDPTPWDEMTVVAVAAVDADDDPIVELMNVLRPNRYWNLSANLPRT
jgi:hypothetical protein